MTIEELKNLKNGDKIYTLASAGIPAKILEDLDYSYDSFTVIELTYIDCLGDDEESGWVICSEGKDMCWFNVKFQGVKTTSHTLNLQRTGALIKDIAQVLALQHNDYKIEKEGAQGLLEEYQDKFPEYFV